MANDWRKVAKKVGWSVSFVLVSGAIVLLTEQKMYMFLVPVLEGLKNFVKHQWEVSWL